MKKETYTTTLGEVIEYPTPAPDVAAFLRRCIDAAEDPRVSEDGLVGLIYGAENPVLEQGRFEGRGAVTKAVLANPLYGVFLDLLDHKRVALGKTTVDAQKAAYSVRVSDAAVELSMTPDAVRKAIVSGHLLALNTPDGYRIDPRSIADYKATRKPRGPSRGPALEVVMGSAPGLSFRAKFVGLHVVEKSKSGDGGSLARAEVAEFRKGAICFSEKKANGKTLNRCFVLAPAARASKYEHGPFSVSGKFKIIETENDEKRAAQLFREFVAE